MKLLCKKLVVVCMLSIVFCGCDGVDELVNMLNCKFEVQSIENFTFAGVLFDELDSLEDISDADMAIIDEAIAAENAPVHFILNILGTNPNDVIASVEKLQWIMAVDGLDVAEGVVTKRFTIPAQETNILSLDVDANVMSIYNDSIVENVYSLYQDIINGHTSIATLKIKPTVNETEFPNYITLQFPIKNEE